RILFHVLLQGGHVMPKKRLDVNWKREVRTEDFKPALRRYTRYLEENGLMESTISSCCNTTTP
ncbi:MAG: hypothetical protein ACPLLR_00250, partial [Methanothrix sp.]|uniref:hypothetical protein n=1 Tax=Methanothrix sp. TaxID=90426 RepID=UPI003C7864A5